jgi:Glycerol uptake facilitator and related permeases (Major Intrinsic Protein Family)
LQAIRWQILISEFVGTGLLIAVGLSVVIVDFGSGGTVSKVLPSAGERRALTGFLFGCVGALITVSPVGRLSGAHINPVVSLAFWLERKLPLRFLLGYIAAQLTGAILGATVLLLWGSFGKSVHYAASVPGSHGVVVAALGEAATTFCLVTGVFAFLGTRSIRRFTPLLLPPLYAIMVYLEGHLSGTSTNPARTLGPAVISGDWHGFWAYLLGPTIGAVAAVALRRLPALRRLEVEVAKVYHFAHDPYHVFPLSLR